MAQWNYVSVHCNEDIDYIRGTVLEESIYKVPIYETIDVKGSWVANVSWSIIRR